MNTPKNLNDREREFRKEMAQRTVNLSSTDVDERKSAGDSPQLIEIGREITRLIEEEQLEDARDLALKSLQSYPDELMLLNFQMIIHSMLKEFGNYDNAKNAGLKLIEKAVEENNAYYTMVGLNNLGLIAHKEGHEEFSLSMYLAAHSFDRGALFTLCNLAGWYSRKNEPDKAMTWINRIIELNENWQQDDEIISFFKKDESLFNLRQYDRFETEILSKLDNK